MYQELYLKKKEEYEFLKNSKRLPMLGGSMLDRSILDRSMLGGSESTRKVKIIGYATCPHFQNAVELANQNFASNNIEVKTVNRKGLTQEYVDFKNSKFDENKFVLYNKEQQNTSPLVLVYNNDKPIMYGGCDNFETFLKLP